MSSSILTIIPLTQSMSEVIIRNTISNINFIIDYNLDINLPKEAEDSEKFLEELINTDIKNRENNNYFIEDKDFHNKNRNSNISEEESKLHKNQDFEPNNKFDNLNGNIYIF